MRFRPYPVEMRRRTCALETDLAILDEDDELGCPCLAATSSPLPCDVRDPLPPALSHYHTKSTHRQDRCLPAHNQTQRRNRLPPHQQPHENSRGLNPSPSQGSQRYYTELQNAEVGGDGVRIMEMSACKPKRYVRVRNNTDSTTYNNSTIREQQQNHLPRWRWGVCPIPKWERRWSRYGRGRRTHGSTNLQQMSVG